MVSAITLVRRVAKKHGLKIKTKSYSFGRHISLVDSDGDSIGNVWTEERLTQVQAFHAELDTINANGELKARLVEEEGDFGKLVGVNDIFGISRHGMFLPT